MGDNNKKKVLIIFFGQPRFTKNMLVSKSHKIHIIDKYHSSIFATLWNSKNSTYTASSWVKVNNNNLVSESFMKEIISQYSDINVEYIDTIDIDSPVEIQEELTNAYGRQNLNNILSHLYIFEEAAMRVISSVDINDFDFVIISRTDLFIKKFPNLNHLDKGFYISSHHSRFPDFIFILSPEYLKFTSVFSNLKQINLSKVPHFIPEYVKKYSLLHEYPNIKIKVLSLKELDVELVREMDAFRTIFKSFNNFFNYLLHFRRFYFLAAFIIM